MAKVEIDLLENSLDSSGDNDHILGLVDDGEGTYESNDCGRSQIICQPILDGDEDNSTYSFKDISGSMTYKLVQIPEENSISKMATRSPANGISNGEFYVINSPAQVFGTAATQKKATKGQPPIEKVVTTKKRDDKRRATHNEVERRRRDKINTWIGKLAALIPNSGLPDTTSKGGILAKACDYIIQLTKTQKRLIKLEKDNEKLALEILRLNKEIAEMRNENNSMRLQLADNCVVTNPRKGSRS